MDPVVAAVVVAALGPEPAGSDQPRLLIGRQALTVAQVAVTGDLAAQRCAVVGDELDVAAGGREVEHQVGVPLSDRPADPAGDLELQQVLVRRVDLELFVGQEGGWTALGGAARDVGLRIDAERERPELAIELCGVVEQLAPCSVGEADERDDDHLDAVGRLGDESRAHRWEHPAAHHLAVVAA